MTAERDDRPTAAAWGLFLVIEVEPTRVAPAWRPVLRAAGVELPG